MRFHRFNRRRADLESRLRAARAEPREDFVRQLAGELRPASSPHRAPWSRLAFAGALSTMILGSLASFGGLGYAASGATGTYDVVKQIVVKHEIAVSVHKSSAGAQYPSQPPPPTNVPAGTNVASAGGVASAQQTGTLPFTGISLLGTVIVSLGLIVVGLILRRRERDSS
jgi:hypothetical protein